MNFLFPNNNNTQTINIDVEIRNPIGITTTVYRNISSIIRATFIRSSFLSMLSSDSTVTGAAGSVELLDFW